MRIEIGLVLADFLDNRRKKERKSPNPVVKDIPIKGQDAGLGSLTVVGGGDELSSRIPNSTSNGTSNGTPNGTLSPSPEHIPEASRSSSPLISMHRRPS